MTRIFTDGAEFQDVLFWDTPGVTGISTSVYRSGVASYAFTTATPVKNISNYSEFYLRFGLYMSLTATTSRIVAMRKSTTVLDSLYINTATAVLEARLSTGTVLATGSIAISPNTWYLIEIHLKIGDSPNGVFQVKVDGVDDINYSGDTKPGSDTTVDNMIFGRDSGSALFYVDDLALNDTSGSEDNSWCDDGHIVLLLPDSDGDVTTWSGSDGDMTNNYLLVDEIPSDGDTTYVESVTISGYDLYNLEASALTGTSIRRVWVESRTKNTVAAGGQVAHVIKTGGVEYVGSGIDLLTSYTRCIGEEYTQNPNTATAWTVANLDALQVGPLVKSTG